MTEPVTTVDERFSDPGAVPTPWATTEAALEAAQLSWLTTVRADGRPHVTPLVSVWLDGAAYFTTGRDEQKAVNLRSNTAVVLTTGCNGWQGGLDVMIEGHAEQMTGLAAMERLAGAWAAKWDGQWRFRSAEDGFLHEAGGLAYVFRVRPDKVLAFGKSPFSHTRHVFTY